MAGKSDKKQPEAAPAEPAPAAPAKKGLNVKMIGIVAAAMVVQAGGVFYVARMTSPKPVAAEVQVQEGEVEDLNAFVEVPLIEERFQNMQSGRAFIWDTAIVLKVKAKDEELVTKTLERRAAEVKEGISLIFRRAPHTQLLEPGLETINRQILAYLNDVVEKDAEGKPRVQRIIIPRCKGFPAD